MPGVANRLTSRRHALSPADVAALDSLAPGGLHSSWLEFLLRYNVAVPERSWCGAERFAVAHFFGISAVPGEDFATAVGRYRDRLAARHVPIADAAGGNLVCMDAKGRIFYWDHERHDRALDEEGTLEDLEPPVLVAATLDEFIHSLAPEPARPTLKSEDVVTVVKSEDFDELFEQYRVDDGQ